MAAASRNTCSMAATLAPAACCDHGPGAPCYAHSCCTCCQCPPDAAAWRSYLALGGAAPEREFLALSPGERARCVACLHALWLAAGVRGLRYG